MSRKIDLIGIGYCGIDMLAIVPYIPIDDKVEIRESLIQAGGPAATAIHTAATLGAATAFCGTVGRDSHGEAIRASMEAAGTDTRGLLERTTGQSPMAFCWVDASSGGRSIAWSRGSVQPLTPEEIDQNLIGSAQLLHMDGHQTAAARTAAEHARAGGVTVAMDAGTVVEGVDSLLFLSDIIIASEHFAQRFTGLDDPAEAAVQLFHEHCKFTAVTLGERGCIGFDGQSTYAQPSFKVDVVDTTGAGDVFHGAFLYSHLQGESWAESLRFAAAVSALKCTKFGGRTGIPTLEEVRRFLKAQDEQA